MAEKEDMLDRIGRKLVEIPPNRLGVIYDLSEKLAGQNGEIWHKESAKFLRKKPKIENVVPMEHIVNCDKMPGSLLMSGEWNYRHRKMGNVKLENREGRLYANSKEIVEVALDIMKKEEIMKMELLNACFMNYFYEHQELIPWKWKRRKRIFFLGTILEAINRYEWDCVACLEWKWRCWHRTYWLLPNVWTSDQYAAKIAA